MQVQRAMNRDAVVASLRFIMVILLVIAKKGHTILYENQIPLLRRHNPQTPGMLVPQ